MTLVTPGTSRESSDGGDIYIGTVVVEIFGWYGDGG